MKTVIQFHLKSFNPPELREEVEAALAADRRPTGLNWAGFYRVSDREMAPNAGPERVGVNDGPEGTVEDWADPGELRWRVPDDFTAGEETTLNDVCIAHDHTQLTAEQVRRDTDVTDLQLLADNWQAYKDDTLTPAQKHQFEWRAFRILLRQFKGEAI